MNITFARAFAKYQRLRAEYESAYILGQIDVVLVLQERLRAGRAYIKQQFPNEAATVFAA